MRNAWMGSAACLAALLGCPDAGETSGEDDADAESTEPDADGGADLADVDAAEADGLDDLPDVAPDEGGDGDAAIEDDGGDAAVEDVGDADGRPEIDATPGWRVRTTRDTELFLLVRDCLEPRGTVAAGTELDAWGMDDLWVRVSWDGEHVARADVEIVEEPPPGEFPAPTSSGTVGLEETGIFALDATGCAVSVGTAVENDEFPAYGLSHDPNFRGYWQVSTDLHLVAVRVLNVEGWIFPWHRAVLLLKEIPGTGFVIGGGVLVAPDAILTAAHMAVDSSFCYVLAPNIGVAWGAGEGVCGTIAEFVTHPEADFGVVRLSAPELRVPPIEVLGRWAEVGDEFFVVNMSTMHYNAMADAAIDEVDGRNAGLSDPTCRTRWTHGSSFTTTSTVVGGGDSGGPAFVGAGLAGLVHGEACRWPWEPYRQVFVHVPFFVDWLDGVLAGG